MSETLRLILTKFTDETITVFSTLLFVTMGGIIVYWFYNRKKFHQLSHEIPASVVKNYLDSIIQNSTSLKSSLFRGGGLDLGNGVPSVVPIGELPVAGNISIGTTSVAASSEEINQKNAEIQSLSIKLSDRTKQITDLEKRMQEIGGADVAKLQAQLAEARAAAASSAGDENLQKELSTIRERLKEYEIIEEDLANLKRLQQENDQLKAQLSAFQKGESHIEVEEVEEDQQIEELEENQATQEEELPVEEEVAEAAKDEAEDEIDLEAEMAKAITESKAPSVETKDVMEVSAQEEKPQGSEQKSAEELLQEFEKMLG